MSRWCTQCLQYGHRKWLFLGTHRTHRMYLRYRMWKTERVIKKALTRKNKAKNHKAIKANLKDSDD